MPTCSMCLQVRRRSLFRGGVCESCEPIIPVPPPLSYPLAGVIALAEEWHRVNKWVTESEARDKGLMSSAWHMRHAWGLPGQPTTPPPAVVEWIASLESRPEESCTDYENAVVLLSKTGYVTDETWGLACSIYHAWVKTRTVTPAEQAKPAEASGAYYGTIGERYDIPDCQCYEHKSLGTNEEHPEWGERFLIKFTAATGEELVWFASSGGKFDPQIGGTYNVRATVFKHEDYNGRRQTIIQRPAEYDPAVPKKGKKK
jgi:hypothetical protein